MVGGHVEGMYFGEPAEVGRFGLGDPRLRLAINLYGAPAMTPKEFVPVSPTDHRRCQPYSSAAARTVRFDEADQPRHESLVAQAGGWHLAHLLANGSWRRWRGSGCSRTTRTSLADARGEQDPIAAMQVHVTYRFKRTMWLAADANYFTGGRTTIGGKQNLDFQRNSRIGATFSSAIDRRQAIRISVSRGAYTTIGADFSSIGVGYNYAWAR